MRRREFIALVGAAAACPSSARGQQPSKMHHVAVVHPSASIGDMNEDGNNSGYRALFHELRRLGYIEGQNLIVERYSAEGRQERYVGLARDVVHTKPDVIFATSAPLVRSFKAATDTIPIVGFMADPVAFGIVASLARPGGNITGVTGDAGNEIWGKRLQILREAVPMASKFGFLTVAPWAGAKVAALQQAAAQAQITLLGPALESPIDETEYQRVLGAMVQEHADGLIVDDISPNFTHRQLIVDSVQKVQLPAVYPYREHFEKGGLIAYAFSVGDLWRRLAGYIDQVLRGATPGEMAIYQASKFELLLNWKTAKALRINIPPTLFAQADEVIE